MRFDCEMNCANIFRFKSIKKNISVFVNKFWIKSYQQKILHYFSYFLKLLYDIVFLYTVDSRYLELAYLEQPLISKWKSGPCYNIEIYQQATKYCGKEEKLLLRSNFSSFPQYFQYISNLGVKLHIHSVKGGCSINCFPQFRKSDMSKYGYLEVFHRVPWSSR